MNFKIFWDEKAHEYIDKLEPFIAKRIEKKISELSQNPFSKDVKKLKAIDALRLRAGDYRIIFKIEQGTIFILKIGHRKNIYKTT